MSGLLEASDVTLGGFAGASLAFFLAAWKESGNPGTSGPSLVITATQEECDELLEELETFSSMPVKAFPAWESLFLPDSVPDGEICHERLKVVKLLLRDPEGARFLVAPVQALLQPVPSRQVWKESVQLLRVGVELRPDALAEVLVRSGMERVSLVEMRGEFSLRGDILDLFSYDAEFPYRLEFFGDTLESVRQFRPETQRSIRSSEITALDVFLPRRTDFFQDCFRGDEVLLADLMGPAGRIVLKEPEQVLERTERLCGNLAGEDAHHVSRTFVERLTRVPTIRASSLPVGSAANQADLGFRSVERFRGGELEAVFGRISDRLDSGSRFEVYCESDAEAKRLVEILQDHGLADREGIRARVGPVRHGFEVVSLSSVVLTTRELFNRRIVRRVSRRAVSSRAIQSFLELEKGDLVVHLVHGIGRYLGIESFERNGVLEEFLAVEYRNKVKVYVPVSKIDLIQKYIGSGDRPVVLDKVGGTSWTRKKEEVARALMDLASELIEIQALRQERPGLAYPEASEWQREFEASFPYDDTPDQVEATEALHRDMQSARPMDRLLCGDVGYGKTELAMRAIFKTVDAGKQAAVLVPTTVLAQQHYRTFRERMSGFPVNIEVLSRFRTPREQRATIQGLSAGAVDVVVGTHRLLSGDVAFRDLGLVIIDEEQRFGVAHKEKLKKMRSTVDVLTLTATPIPRTLHMALLGIRDISSLTTAPEGRCPVRTDVIQFEPRRVREIVLRELNREGQIYFVHNRIEDIDRVKCELEQLVPEARIEFAHGRMSEHELEERMLRFFEGEIDCLVSTTIIESGLDIPNVNTIFIDEADRYGLADLHQLRGRVGRYKHQAYCYLILPKERMVNPDARKRLQALVEFSDLGAGFQIAMRDLEIRGAGNILGPEQSGHIAAVGYDMYCRLLEQAVRSLKQESAPAVEAVEVEIDLALAARVPETYRSGESGKIALYRRIAACSSLELVEDLSREITDRFGPYPAEVALLLDVQRLRLLCVSRGVEYIGRDGFHIVLKGRESMQQLLEGVPGRVAILDSRTVAVPLVQPGRRYPPRIRDESVFQVALEWLRTGAFPRSLPVSSARADRRGISRSGR